MTKRKTADQAQDNTPTENEAVNPAAQPPAAASQRQSGNDTAVEQAAEPNKSSWAARTTIAVPLTEEAKRDHTKGEVARYVDGYNSGVGARIDSPDQDFRPSEEVKEPLKEEHPYRESMRWNDRILHNDKKTFHKQVKGQRRDGSERSPVGERLDAEERFEEMVERRRNEIEKTDGGKVPF